MKMSTGQIEDWVVAGNRVEAVDEEYGYRMASYCDLLKSSYIYTIWPDEASSNMMNFGDCSMV